MTVRRLALVAAVLLAAGGCGIDLPDSRSVGPADPTTKPSTPTPPPVLAPPGSILPAHGPEPFAGLLQVSADPLTAADDSAEHATEAEADTSAFGTTMVSVFQVGRNTDGGATHIGWATTFDAGRTWGHGILPPGSVPARLVSDPSVAYDAEHDAWLVLSLFATGSTSGLLINRSTDGARTWSSGEIVTGPDDSGVDKDWLTCDNSARSPYRGTCYVAWDAADRDGQIRFTVSGDGGRRWSQTRTPAGRSSGVGVQLIVRPDGTVVVPFIGYRRKEAFLAVVTSADGGDTWTALQVITALTEHPTPRIRSYSLPVAEVDGRGRIYLAWSDCRFRAGCAHDDVVLATSEDGRNWSVPARVPLDDVSSHRDHIIPGLAVDTTGGGPERLAVFAYRATGATVGAAGPAMLQGEAATSVDGGRRWSRAATLGPAFEITDLVLTQNVEDGQDAPQRFAGDYLSGSVLGARAWTVLAVPRPVRSAGRYDQAMFVPDGGLPLTGGDQVAGTRPAR